MHYALRIMNYELKKSLALTEQGIFYIKVILFD